MSIRLEIDFKSKKILFHEFISDDMREFNDERGQISDAVTKICRDHKQIFHVSHVFMPDGDKLGEYFMGTAGMSKEDTIFEKKKSDE